LRWKRCTLTRLKPGHGVTHQTSRSQVKSAMDGGTVGSWWSHNRIHTQ
jgi:hypothetical protein